MVELVQIHRIQPEALRAGMLGSARSGAGVHHFSYIVDDARAESARLEALGIPAILQAGQGPIQITFHAGAHAGTAIEIHQHGDAIDGLFAVVRAAAEAWDGTDPLRDIPA